MSSVTQLSVSTDFVYLRRKYRNRLNDDYNFDMWKEMRKRWLVFAVLLVIMCAVLAPRVGAPGGPLRTEYLWFVPHSYVYYAAGRRAGGPGGTGGRLLLLSAAHAHVVAPSLCVLVVAAFRDGVDHRVVKGALVSSVGAPCAWLSLSLAHHHAASLTAVNYLSSLLAEPLTMLIICGRATIPPLGGVITTLASTLPPFALGLLRPQPHSTATSKLPALLLLYVDCCERLKEAEGGLYIADVLVILMLEASYVCASAACCELYRRSGLLPQSQAAALRCCAVPKALAHGWQSWGACSAGLSPLPAVFLAPAQALVLAALTEDIDDDLPTDDYELVR